MTTLSSTTNAVSRTVPIIPTVQAHHEVTAAAGPEVTVAPAPASPQIAPGAQRPAPASPQIAPGAQRPAPASPQIAPGAQHPAPASLHVPAARVPQSTPAAAQTAPGQSTAGAYFELFRTCSCGHSSAWHSGAFGDAWRSGQQVRGACEAAADLGARQGCSCRGFAEAR